MNNYKTKLISKILGYLLIIILLITFSLLIMFIWDVFPDNGKRILLSCLTFFIPIFLGWIFIKINE